MISANTVGDMPEIDSGAYVDPTARIIGNVHISAGCYIGPQAIIRADEIGGDGKVAPIKISENTNIQDAVIIHALAGAHVNIGSRCSVAHGAVIHGPCTINDGCFVGFRAVVFNSTLHEDVFVGISAVVQSVELPKGSLVGPSFVILSAYDVNESVGQTTSADRDFMKDVADMNIQLTKGYLQATGD